MEVPITVKTRETSLEETDTTTTPTTNACKICLENEAKYTCPRCNLAYCSVSCYQHENHTNCSEAFYKDCVMTELQDMNSTEVDKKKVMEILTRQMEEREDEDDIQNEDEHEDLAERLQGLDLDKDVSAVWGRLSDKEKEEFAQMLQDGRMARLIEMWTPWWKCPKNLSLVTEDVKNPDSKAKEDNSVMPTLVTDVPDINTLLKNSRPSSDCRFDLLNILFAYSFVSRIHNGDHHETPVDSSQLMLEVSMVLRCDGRCSNVGEAVQYSLDSLDQYNKREQKLKTDWSPHFNLKVLEDVSIIVSGPGYTRSSQCPSLTFIAAALSDVIRLIQKALAVVKKELKQNKSKDENLTNVKSQLFKADKKCVFFLSWLQRYGMGMQQLIPLLRLEIERRQSDVKEVEDLKECVEQNMEQLKSKEEKKLIEEL